ncbi:protein of unknown function [Candidatus Nitrospira inopinata]|uniref:Uncharacterized protein n=1 Tax=Candidatus Nitrospira inopinata TaxID=1715989 RepID=A0A0S4KUD2_9BACT|nr:protein of unknown function [Candidatus Nitrospira inopinata]
MLSLRWDSDLKKKGLRQPRPRNNPINRSGMGFRPEEKGIKTPIHSHSDGTFGEMGFRPEEKGIKTPSL